MKKYNLCLDNKFWIQFTFNIIDNLCKMLKRHKLKIDSIEKNHINNEYLIKFIYVSKRQIFIMPASILFKNESLLNKFSQEEAAEIGMFHACTHFEKINTKF
ncbi:MAG: hypothetical protein KBD37_05085 [Burkholderiales bacterium]|nr:hypothetical protein [Burkholderiales bacterium]